MCFWLIVLPNLPSTEGRLGKVEKLGYSGCIYMQQRHACNKCTIMFHHTTNHRHVMVQTGKHNSAV